ncbi:hypothetical protein Esti_001980 [Eimeria stiedai]
MSDGVADASAAGEAALRVRNAAAGPAAGAGTDAAALAAGEAAAAETGAGEKEEGELVPPEFECSICMKILLLPVTTPCGHNFCRTCIEQSLSYRPMCPLCRAPLLHCAVPVVAEGGRVGGRANLSVNTLLQQLLEAQYPRMMAARAAEAAAAAAAAAHARRSRGAPDNPEQQLLRLQQQRQLLPLYFVLGEQLQRLLRRPESWRGEPLALQANPLVPGETCTVRIYEEKYIHLVQLALQFSHHFGVVLPPIDSQTVGARLPQVPGPGPYATQGPPAAAAAGSLGGDGGLARSADAGVYGYCVEIEHHSLVQGGGPEEGPPGVCVIRCVCKNRFRLVDILLQHGGVLADQQQQEGEPHAHHRPQQQRQQQQQQQQQQQGEESEEAFAARLAAAVASPDFSIGVCYPVVDGLPCRPPPSAAAAADAPAGDEQLVQQEQQQRQQVQEQQRDVVMEAAERFARSPLSRHSNLAEEYAAVKALLSHYAEAMGFTAQPTFGVTVAVEVGFVAARRLSEICIEGLHRQLAQSGEVAQRIFSSKYGRIPVLSERVTPQELAFLSFFFCKVVVASPVTRWQWFLTTNTLERLLSVSRIIVDAHWMNVLHLSSVPTSSLSRFLLLQDIQSNLWLFGLVLLLLLACRSFPSLFFDQEL